jgi:hypothetical protein
MMIDWRVPLKPTIWPLKFRVGRILTLMDYCELGPGRMLGVTTSWGRFKESEIRMSSSGYASHPQIPIYKVGCRLYLADGIEYMDVEAVDKLHLMILPYENEELYLAAYLAIRGRDESTTNSHRTSNPPIEEVEKR